MTNAARRIATRKLRRALAADRVVRWRQLARQLDQLRDAVRQSAPVAPIPPAFTPPHGAALTIAEVPACAPLPAPRSPAPSRPRPVLIDLSSAPSSMERQAVGWSERRRS